MTMAAQPLTIVIPNYNGMHLLRRNLPTVAEAAAQYPGEVTIVVVDDGSADDSVSVLREEFPAIEVVVHAANRGFSEAVRSGVEHARTELLMLLNSDVELLAGCLERLEPYFDNSEVFSVCPLILREDGTTNRHSWNIRRFRSGYLRLADWDLDSAREARTVNKLPTLYSSGGGMMVSRSKFLALDGFHPIFKPYYGEDFDLGIRAWYRGWPSYFEPEAALIHQSQGSIKDNAKRSRVKQVRRRNKYFIEWIHIPTWRLLVTTVPANLMQLLWELLRLDRVNLKGFVNAAAHFPEAIAVRRSLRDGRVMELPEVLERIHDAYRSRDANRS
jgi:GT2 family glycosyltransferase